MLMQRIGSAGPAAMLMALAITAFIPAVTADWIWDDDLAGPMGTYAGLPGTRYDHPLTWIWTRVGSIDQYYPLVHTTFWLEHRAWGAWPAGYHAVNVLLHAASAVVLFRLLSRLGLPGAWLAAAVFAVHPVTVESVAWVTERKNTLSMLFALLCLDAWARRRFPSDGAAPAPAAATTLIVPAALFVAALLSKTVAITVVGVMPVITWWKLGRLTAWDARDAATLLAIGLPLACLTAWLEKTLVGATGGEWSHSFADRIVIACRVIWFYAGTLAWPSPLAFFYPRWQIDSAVAVQWVPCIALVAAGAAALVWARTVSGPVGRGPLAVMLLYAGILFPALGFFDVYPFRYSFVADHFQYHASAAVFAGAAAGFVMACRHGRLGHAGAVIVAAACIGTCAFLTFSYSRVFRNAETLYRDVLEKVPASWVARTNLGLYLFRTGRAAEAEAVYREQLARPEDIPWPHDRALLLHDYGVLLDSQARLDEAEAAYRAAIAADPAYLKPRNNLANLLADTGRLDEAMREFTALLARPMTATDRSRYRTNRGICLAEHGRWEAAERELEAVVEHDPASAGAREWLGISLLEQGRPAEAERHFQACLAVAATGPDQARAWLNLAAAQEAAGRTEAAAESLLRTAAADRANPRYADEIGSFFRRRGRQREADDWVREADRRRAALQRNDVPRGAR